MTAIVLKVDATQQLPAEQTKTLTQEDRHKDTHTYADTKTQQSRVCNPFMSIQAYRYVQANRK